jgi:hypothetical protein
LVFVILKVSTIPVIALTTALSIYIRTSPYEPTEALMDLVARAGCPAAAAIGLADMRKGELGYHARNDPDGDGVACPRVTSPVAAGPEVPGETSTRTVGGAKFLRP